jgi:adhesin/invasin
MNRHVQRLIALAATATAGGVLLLSCSDETGPSRSVPGWFAVAPRFTSASAGIVPVARGRFMIHHLPDDALIQNTVVDIASDADSVDLTLSVPMLHASDTFALRIALVSPAGDTVFRAGPITVRPVSSGPVPVVDVPLAYVGVGANAAGVEILSGASVLVSGEVGAFIAVARDSAGAEIPGTPIAWGTLDPALVTVSQPDTGLILANNQRGTARVVAQLLTGPADTASVGITLPPATIVADSGAGQTGPAAGALPNRLVARVAASDGVAIPDVWVRFAANLAGSVIPDSALTDSGGRAATVWTLGNTVGAQLVTASIAELPGATAQFSATAVATGAGLIVKVAGDLQTGVVGTMVPVAPTVRVTDLQDNPVPNVEVTFSVSGGGGNVTVPVDTTDAAGLADAGVWVMGAATGLNMVTVNAAALTPVTFVALATTPGGATAMTLNAGNGQTAPAGSAVAVAPSVLVTDTTGAPVGGVTVNFAITAGGGTPGAPSAVSDAAGIAAAGSWTLGSVGTNFLTASLLGVPNVVFSATATVGAPANVVVISGDGQSADAGTALPQPLVAEVRDAAGNPVPGASVTWTALQGSVVPAAVTTDGAGRAQTSWTLATNTIVQTATATVSGVTPAVFSATAIFSSPTVLLALSGTDRIVVGGQATLAITLTAPAPVNGVVVSVTSDNPALVGVDTTTVFIPQDGTTGQITLFGNAGGTAVVRGIAPGYAEGTVSIPVSVQVLSMPLALNVPFGGTASLPLQISTPAPAGGVTVTLVSSNPSSVAVLTPSVVIPQGSQTTNATVSGVFPGAATVSGTTADFGNAQSTVTTTANFDITVATTAISASFGTTITIELESGGTPIAAPAPGMAITLTPRNPACVAAASPVTIPTGLVNTTSAVSYGGSAPLSCTSYLVAEAPDIAPDSVNVTVNPQPGISQSAVTVGAGLQRASNAFLGASNHGGVDVVVKTLDPTLARVAPDGATPGGDSTVTFVPNGSTFISYTVEGVPGVADTGQATVQFEVSAPGFTPDTVAHTIRQTAVRLGGLGTATTTFSPDIAIVAQIGVLNSAGTALQEFQNLRAGAAPLVATIVLSDSTVARLVTTPDTGGTATVQIAAQAFQSPSSVATGGAAFEPVLAGVTTATVSIPGVVSEPGLSSTTVTISAPGISQSAVTVGAGLQRASNAFLGASNHGGVDVVVKTLDPTLARVAPDGATPGGDSTVTFVPNGSTFISYTVEGAPGVADTGQATVQFEVSAPGFTPDTVAHTIRQTAVRLGGLGTATTTFSPDIAIVAQIGVLNSAGTALQEFQNLRAGAAPLVATIVLSDSTVARLVTTPDTGGTATVQIAAQAFQSPSSVATGGAAFEPVLAGVTTATVSIPGIVPEPGLSSATVTITAPAISQSAVTVGAGLQRASNAFLGASNHGGVDVVVKTLDPTLARVAPDGATPGGDSTVTFVPDGSTFISYTVEGVPGVADTGQATVQFEVSAPGFTPDTIAHTVRRAAVRIGGLAGTITTLSPDNPFVAQIGVLNSAGTALQEFQNLRAGAGSVTATITNSASGAGQLVTLAGTGDVATVQIAPQTFQSPGSVAAGGVAFEPLTADTTIVAVTIPGFVQEPGLGAQMVVVTTPAVNLSQTTVGAGLQRFASGSLGASDHGGVWVVIESSQPGVAFIAPNDTTPGRGLDSVFVANGTTFFSYYVQGVEGQTGTVTITARAIGFTDGSTTATVVAPAIDISSLTVNPTAGAADNPFTIRLGISSGTAFLTELQAIRAGGTPLDVAVTTSNPAAGLLITSDVPSPGGSSVVVRIALRAFSSPSTVATGGVAFNPEAAGTTVVAASAVGFITTANGSVTVNVSP